MNNEKEVLEFEEFIVEEEEEKIIAVSMLSTS